MARQKALNIAQLPENTREELQMILEKDLNVLTVYDIAFLKARSGYLTAEQREYFADALKGKVRGVDAAQIEDAEAEGNDFVDGVHYDEDEDGNRVINAKRSKHAPLLQMARDADLPVSDDMTKSDLANLLNHR